jgi:pimeloyl-ACP methyl ester carboxylesterase
MKEKYIIIKCPITNEELNILCGISKIHKKNKKIKLFLHGIGSNIDSWKDVIDKIKGPLIFINMVGNGYSSSIPDIILNKTNNDLLNYFNLIIDEVLNYFEVDKKNLHIIGHSFGSLIGSSYAKNNSCKELSLICPYGMFRITNSLGHYWAILFKFGIIDFIYKITNLFNPKMKYTSNMIIDKFITTENILIESFCNITFFDFITTTQIPVNLIYGYHDLIIPLHQGLVIQDIRMKNKLNTNLNIILHTGHSGLSMDKIYEEEDYKASFDFINNSNLSTSIYKQHLTKEKHYTDKDFKLFCDETHISELFNKKNQD